MRFAQPAAAGAALLPHAAVRTAGAVRDLSDSSLIVRLTRGRSWIAVLGVLLTGIVAVNVVILSLNAGAGVAGERIDALERQNSSLRAELAEKLSAGRVEADAAALGMYVPDAKDVTYLRADKDDVADAASALGP
jgi:Tfp pilus assembly protein PilN